MTTLPEAQQGGAAAAARKAEKDTRQAARAAELETALGRGDVPERVREIAAQLASHERQLQDLREFLGWDGSEPERMEDVRA